MRRERVIVLKFGGSVLRREDDLHHAAQECYRWLRGGWRIIAVVSALEGRTADLLASARSFADPPHESATAALAATGEATTAALLTLALDRAGIPAETLDPGAIGLLTEGPALDAGPVALDERAVRSALDRSPVLVVPGFIGRDAHGRTTLLGRGGSDLTALFIAQRLNARCRLVKDVDGLYERDPAQPGPAPRLFDRLHWDDALALDGSIVQHKGVRFARAHALPFEVGALQRSDATLIGPHRVAFSAQDVSPPPLRVTLLGLGTVGLGVYESLSAQPERFEIVRALVRDAARAERAGVPRALITTDPDEAAETEADLVIEALGGVEPARTLIARAIESGRHVVTANKAVIAAHGSELATLAERHAVTIAWSAAAGGAAPVLERLCRENEPSPVVRIEAVLNGTANFVLDRVSRGDDLAHAVEDAKARGLAEADPSRDLDGRDAGDKAVLAVHAATGEWIGTGEIECEPINGALIERCRCPLSSALRQIVRIELGGGVNRASVACAALPAEHPLAGVTREWNGALITRANGATEFVRGKGAGRQPTALAVVADGLDLWRADAALTPEAAGEVADALA